MRKNIYFRSLTLTAVVSLGAVSAVSVAAEDLADNQIYMEVSALESDLEIIDYVDEISVQNESADCLLSSDESREYELVNTPEETPEDLQMNMQNSVSETEQMVQNEVSAEALPDLQIEEICICEEGTAAVLFDSQEEMSVDSLVTAQIQAQSSGATTINITDDTGYVWTGYYNSDGTITINGTQELWGNAKSSTSSANNDALIIPESIGGKTVSSIGVYDSTKTFDVFDESLIRKIVFPKTAVSFSGGYADFQSGLLGDFSNLEELDLGGLEEDSEYLFGGVDSDPHVIPLKKLTMKDGSSILWYSLGASETIRAGITELTLWGDTDPDTWYNDSSIYLDNYSGLQTLKLSGSFYQLGLENCPELTAIESSTALDQIYFTALKNCPKLTITKVKVRYNALSQNCMFENSSVQEITIDFQNASYCTIYKSVFCKACNLKAIHVVNPGNLGFYSSDGILYWKYNQQKDLFFYPPAKNPGGEYQVPSDLTCIYAFAFYGNKLNKVVFPEDLTSDYYWDRVNTGNWYTTADFPEAEGKTSLYVGHLSTVKFSMVKGTAANNYYTSDWSSAYGINASRVEFRKGSTYKITYNLDGGTNHSANPSSYTVGTEPIELKAPSKKGYTFVKWTNKNGSSVTKTEPYGGEGDLVYTAVWKEQEIPVITGDTKKVAAGKKTTLKVTTSSGTISATDVLWTSSNKKVATVNSKGVVTFKKKSGGKSVTITATLKSDPTAKATYKLTATKNPVTKIKITGKSTMKVNRSQTLKVKVSGKSGAYKKVKWTSSNTKYATVSSKGKVKALKAGKGKTVKITASALDGSGKKATFKIKLK